MKKKLLIALIAITSALCGAFGFSACFDDKPDDSGNGGNTNQGGNTQKPDDGNKPEHTTHTYDQKNTDAKYLKTTANCQHKAVYYFSCACGKQGEETFDYGEFGKHEYITYLSDDNATCANNCTETAICENCDATDTREIPDSATGEHSFINYVSDDNATCINNGTETATCENCEATDSREIPDSKTEHNYVGQTCTVCGNYKATFGLQYTLNADGESYSCTGRGTATDSVISIPGEYNGKIVTTVSARAFAGNTNITSVIIPDSVTSIGDYAFEDCSSLTEIKFKDIASYCQINGLGNVDKSKVYIGEQKLTEMTSIVIPDSVTSIGYYAFEDCSSLTEIKFKDMASYCQINGLDELDRSKVYIGGQKLTEMTSIVIPDSVTSIGRYAFRDCSLLTSITIPDSVTSIGDYAFYGCSSLTSITIPDSVTSIGYFAFAYCSSLQSITIPDSVTSIGNYAFEDCSSLTEIKFKDMASYCQINGLSSDVDRSKVYIGGQKLTEMTSIVIPDGVTSIGYGAFYGCSSLTSITIPDSVTSIDNRAFYGCSSLTSITIPDGVTNIGGFAFHNCSKLTSITIPDSVTSIGDYAFRYCSSLESITIPDSMTSIGEYAFYNCSSLTSITIPSSVTSIRQGAFQDCSSLTSINLPDGVTSIGRYAFNGCSSLTSITIPDSVKFIGNSAFYNCRLLTDITYEGTKAQWESIEKGYSWNNNTGNYTVHCTDGDISKS